MATDVTCALCGLEFDPGDAACAHGCPLSSMCGLVQCPSCHYEFPLNAPRKRRFWPWSWPRRARSAQQVCPERARTLLDMSPGESATVVCFTDGRDTRHNTLAVFGLVPGAEVKLLQQRSSPVVQVGETSLALDRDIAASIVVTPTNVSTAPATSSSSPAKRNEDGAA
jgi:Fe2+ transport system protein FeoA